jgi:hypothetical protein
MSFKLAAAGALATRAWLTSVGNLTLTGDLRVDGGDIGISADTDLIGLAANLLTVNGTVDATGEYRVDGLRVVTNRQAHQADPAATLAALAAWAAAHNLQHETHGLMATS